MHLRIDDVSKGTFTLPEPIDNQEGKLKIGIRSMGYWVGIYNITEIQSCRWARSGEPGTDFQIQPGLYTFKGLARDLKKVVKGLTMLLDKTTGLVHLSLPEEVSLWVPDAVKELFGLDDEGWLQGRHVSDRPVEFLPVGGINIYLDQLSTSNNLSTSKKNNLVKSNLLGNIPMLSENFAQHFSLNFDKPAFKDLTTGNINQLEFSLKLQWRDGTEQKLDNHSLPIGLELEIK